MNYTILYFIVLYCIVFYSIVQSLYNTEGHYVQLIFQMFIIRMLLLSLALLLYLKEVRKRVCISESAMAPLFITFTECFSSTYINLPSNVHGGGGGANGPPIGFWDLKFETFKQLK